MTIDRIIEIFGLVLIGAVIVRVIVAALIFAVRGIRTKLQVRNEGVSFRSQAKEAFDSASSRLQLRSSLPGKSRTLRIVERVAENLKGDICSFHLGPPDNTGPSDIQPLWPYRPGQHLTLALSVPGRERAVVRCYSLSETPTAPQRTYRITVKKLAPAHGVQGAPSGLASSVLHDRLAKGDLVEVGAPAGSFYLDHMSDRPVVLIASGVGITPLMSMLNWLVATKSQREIWVFYGARDRTEIAFANHLKAMDRSTPNLRTVVFFSSPSAQCRRGIDYDVEGHVNVDVMKILLKGRTYEFYLCGPSQMMEAVRRDLGTWGVPADDIKFESFGERLAQNGLSQPHDGQMPDQTSICKSDEDFRIEFARSNKTVPWNQSFGTLLELAEVLGLPAQHSCRAGQCGTCKVPIKCGSVSYLRAPGAEVEAGACLPCIAQPAGDLVLDL